MSENFILKEIGQTTSDSARVHNGDVMRKKKKRYLCSWMYFCRWMNIYITNDIGTFYAVSPSQEMRVGETELCKIQSRTFQGHSASINSQSFTLLSRLKDTKVNINITTLRLNLPRSFDLFPEVEGLICV